MINRFENVFNNTDDTVLVTMKGVHFVLINSVRMEGDGCKLCRAAERKIEKISSTLKCVQGLTTECDNKDAIGEYSRPVLLQVSKRKLSSQRFLSIFLKFFLCVDFSIFQRTVQRMQIAWKVTPKSQKKRFVNDGKCYRRMRQNGWEKCWSRALHLVDIRITIVALRTCLTSKSTQFHRTVGATKIIRNFCW